MFKWVKIEDCLPVYYENVLGIIKVNEFDFDRGIVTCWLTEDDKFNMYEPGTDSQIEVDISHWTLFDFNSLPKEAE